MRGRGRGRVGGGLMLAHGLVLVLGQVEDVHLAVGRGRAKGYG